MSTSTPSVSAALRMAAFERAGGRCECARSGCGHDGLRCGYPLTLLGWQVHDKSGLGEDTLENCEVLCAACHEKRESLASASKEVTMPETGRICDQSGVYRASCCAQEIRLSKGERCPPCSKHGPTTWRLIRRL